jgi:hypothetical protein
MRDSCTRNAVKAFRQTARNAVKAFRQTARNAVKAFRQIAGTGIIRESTRSA